MANQVNVSITPIEWKIAVDYFEAHKEELLLKGISNPTSLIRYWIRQSYQEDLSHK